MRELIQASPAQAAISARGWPALRSFGARAMQTSASRAAAWSGTTIAFPGMPG